MFDLLRNLKVKSKLILLIAIVMVSFLLFMFGTAYFLNKVRVGSNLYFEIKYYRESLTKIASLKSFLHEMQTIFITMLQETDPDRLQLSRLHINDCAIQIDSQFTEVIGRIKDEEIRSLVRDAQATWYEFKDTINNEILPAIFAGNREKVKELAEGIQKQRRETFIEQLSTAVDTMREKITELEDYVDKTVNKNMGLLVGINGILLILIVSLALLIINSITNPLVKVMGLAQKISEGNLTEKEIKIKGKDEIGELASVFTKMAQNLADMVLQIRKSATEIATASDNLAHIFQQSVQNISQISSTISQISSSISQASQSAQNIATLSEEANRSVQEGGIAVENMLKKMNLIRSSAELSIKSMQELAKRSSEINDILNLITKIADQTNLLSLNAAIEAARAGEAGKGFAVVAEEIRKLAESSTQQSQVISQIIHQILSDIQNTQSVVAEETKEIEEGAALINQIYQMIKEISTSTEKVSLQTQQVASTSEEIAAGSQEVSASTEEQTAAIQEVSASATELARTAKLLKETTERFKI